MVLKDDLIWVYANFQLILPTNIEFLLMHHFLGRVAALLPSWCKKGIFKDINLRNQMLEINLEY